MLWILMCVCYCDLMDEQQHLMLPIITIPSISSSKRLSEIGILSSLG
jgi:hypothetical protein